MSVLITGATGFVGRHLADYLASTQPGVDLHGTTIDAGPSSGSTQSHLIDLKDKAAVVSLIDQIRPTHIYHLAAQSSPRLSFRDPWGTLENNILAQLNIFQACLELKCSARILIVSSAEIYQAQDGVITEATPFNPTSPYGVSKIAQDMLALQYFQTDALPVMRARPFNHIGPGQAQGFVAPDFALQIARIEAGQQQPVLQVGNLAARRDFSDVRDVVRAYQLIADHGQPGEVYNVASGAAHSVQDLLDTLLSFSSEKIEVLVDPARFLPVDVPIKLGDASLLHRATGWEPQITFEQSLHDILNECRQRIRFT